MDEKVMVRGHYLFIVGVSSQINMKTMCMEMMSENMTPPPPESIRIHFNIGDLYFRLMTSLASYFKTVSVVEGDFFFTFNSTGSIQ